MAGESVPFPMQSERSDAMNRYDNLQEEFTAGESIGAAFDLAQDDTLSMLAYRSYKLNDVSGQPSPTLSSAEANEKYPMMQPFTEPVKDSVAGYLQKREQDSLKKQMKILNGPQDTYLKFAHFGAGLVAHAMDPLEIGVSLLASAYVGGVLARTAWGAAYATRTAMAARAAGLGTEAGAAVASRLAPTLRAQLANTLAESAAGNLIENVGQEIAIAHQTTAENREYNPDDALLNITASTFMGTGITLGIKAAHWRMNRVLKATTPQADLAVARTIVAQVAEENKPNVEPVARALVNETSVDASTHPNKTNYQYVPVTKESLPKRQFFAVAKGAEFAAAERADTGESYFHGTTLTDSDAVANAKALVFEGVVHPVEPMALNPLDLEQPLSPELQDVFREATKGVIHGDLTGVTGKQALDAIMNAIDDRALPPGVLDGLQLKIMDQGFDSTIHNGSQVAGLEHTLHNVVTVFEGSQLKSQGFLTPDPELRNLPSKTDLQSSAKYDAHSDIFVDPHVLEKFKQDVLNDESLKLDPIKEVDEQINNLREEMKMLEDQGQPMDSDTRLEAERILEMDSVHEAEMMAIKAALHCVRR